MLLLITLLIFCSSAVSAAVVPAPVSLSQSSLNVSSMPKPHEQCVDTGKHPYWNGRILYSDCEEALKSLKHRSSAYADLLYAFYSSADGFEPLPMPQELDWKLPSTTFYQTCEIQVRMIRDFSIIEIPLGKSFLRPVLYPAATISTWHSIIAELEKILRCTRYGRPGWSSDGVKVKVANTAAPIGLFMWGRTSAIARDYLEPDSNKLGILDSGNPTVAKVEQLK